ncbi:hypothetical protein ACSVDM_30100 [Nocardia sp. JW2]|uniref:hypothetical protein n=1 Tax=Nocardia sp. JW2 TaxID=3450738 RepID=UPI003F4372D6
MSTGFNPYPPEAPCPCGSGAVYVECCHSKVFEVGLDEVGDVVRRVPLTEEVQSALKAALRSFSALYGREPVGDDLVFGHVSDPTDSVFSSARHFLDCGVDPAFVYAYVRTDGLFPTADNEGKIPDVDLAMFEEYVAEYHAPVEQSSGHVSSLAFVSIGNEIIESRVQVACEQLRMVLTDFLSRHLSDEHRLDRMQPSRGRVGDFSVQTPLDYAMFSALKTKRTLQTLERISNSQAQESVYALARSVYENTVFLDAIADDESIFWQSISPKADQVNYSFGLYDDGRINYNHVIHRVTGKRAPTNLRFSELAQHPSRSTHGRELYSLFYVTACQFVHVDILSARAYFHDADPFDELNPELIASLIATALIGDLVRALVRSAGVQSRCNSDVKVFLKSLGEGLSEALEYAKSDPDHTNPIFDVLLTMISKW